jgi:hypothetical protein
LRLSEFEAFGRGEDFFLIIFNFQFSTFNCITVIVISKFSSLYFGREEEWKAPFDRRVRFVQKYAAGEEMRVQFTGYADVFRAEYIDEGGVITPVPVYLLYKDNEKRLFETGFSIHHTGAYEFLIAGEADEALSRFCILEPEELKDSTVLLRYTHRRNEYGAVFVNGDGSRRVFNFRIDGGVYPGDRTQALENEIFRDQRFNPRQTAAESYEVSVLKIGTCRGVPQWAGNRVQHIFKLSDVSVNGVEATRNESSVPELIRLDTRYPLYVFNMNIEMTDEERVHPPDNASYDNLLLTNQVTPVLTNGDSYILVNKI